MISAAQEWTVVQRVVFPAQGSPTRALYVSRESDGLQTERSSVTVPPRGSASFGAYFSAFPAGVWRARTTIRRLRLRMMLDGVADLRVRTIDSAGVVRTVAVAEAASGDTTVEIMLEDDALGWVWFEIEAGEASATARDAVWEVPGAARRSSVAICITTFNRNQDCLALLRQLADDEAVWDRIETVLVVDQGDRRLSDTPGFSVLTTKLGARMNYIEQANLGGSGGFSRGMIEAAASTADYALLLDDDVVLETAVIDRMLAFADNVDTPTIVGAQMLSLVQPTLLHSWGERVAEKGFWWGPVRPSLAPVDLAHATIETTPALSVLEDVDFNGWWMCLIPIGVLNRLGFALPLFIKWDDAEFGLRAKGAGVRTVTMPGAALWHMPWTAKDDGLDWQAYFQLRNRLVVALLHSDAPRGGGVLSSSFAQDVNHLLCMQYGSVALRRLALRDVLSGPGHLERTLRSRPATARRILAAAHQVLVADADLPDASAETVSVPRRGPAHMLRAFAHQFRQEPPAGAQVQARLSRDEGKWWRLGVMDTASVASAAGTGSFVLRRSRSAFVALLRDSLTLRVRIWIGWRRLRAAYRDAAPHLVSEQAWKRAFAAGEQASAAEGTV